MTDAIETIETEHVGPDKYLLFGDIDEDSSRDCCEFIFNAVDCELPEIHIFINSAGGCLGSGNAIIQTMAFAKQHNVTVHTYGIGHVQSMGLAIFIAGSPESRHISQYALILSHQASLSLSGKTHEIIDIKKQLAIIKGIEDLHYTKYTNLTIKDAKKILHGPGETYLTAEECIKYGLADDVLEA